jgi:hypothetical protein
LVGTNTLAYFTGATEVKKKNLQQCHQINIFVARFFSHLSDATTLSTATLSTTTLRIMDFIMKLIINDSQPNALSIESSVIMQTVIFLLLCWVSLCWVSLWWTSLRHLSHMLKIIFAFFILSFFSPSVSQMKVNELLKRVLNGFLNS